MGNSLNNVSARPRAFSRALPVITLDDVAALGEILDENGIGDQIFRPSTRPP